MSYSDETTADSVLHSRDAATYAMKRLPGGRVGVWYERPVDRFAKAVTLTSRRNSNDSWVFPNRESAVAYADALGWEFDEYSITK